GRSEEALHSLLVVNPDGLRPALDDLSRDLAMELRELALETPNPGLAGVRLDHVVERPLSDSDPVLGDAVVRAQPRQEMAPRDLRFFLVDVAGDLDDLHAVLERR